MRCALGFVRSLQQHIQPNGSSYLSSRPEIVKILIFSLWLTAFLGASSDEANNDRGVNAWDGRRAFHPGWLEGSDFRSSREGDQMLYALAEHMCEKFGTCTGDSGGDDLPGISAVNGELLSLWRTEQAHLEALEYNDAAVGTREIVPPMAVPLVQGLLRYAYEADPDMVGGAVREKEASELWAFSAAILPWIDLCDVDVAETVRANTDISSAAAPMSDGFASIKAQLESVYACVGITCAEVGGYINSDTGAYFFEPCTDGTGATSDSTIRHLTRRRAQSVDDVFIDMAGYSPVSDVIEKSRLDLDMVEIEVGVDLLTEAGITTAYTAYSEGGNSLQTDSTRTIQSFSTGAEEKLSGEVYFEVWADYWGAPDYADVFTSSACHGTGAFAGASLITRSEGCLKGAQYQNVWMYVIHELEDSVNDCNAGDPYGVNAWDGGWAFYAGSLEGTEVGGSIDGGVMLYALAEEMCETFGTCTGDSDGDSLVGISEVNVNLLSLWQIGQAHLEALECADAAAVIHGIVRLMAVPLVQGLLRFAYYADPEVVGGAVPDKEASELWAFSAAILPWIEECDAAVATTVRANTDISSTMAPMSDGFASIKAQLESVYACMGITCAQVGGYVNQDAGAYFFEPCTDDTGATSDSMVDSESTEDSETGALFVDIAGYTPVSDVVEHSELDIDMLLMEAGADELTESGFTGAYMAYSEGGNSEKDDGAIQTIQSFSTDAGGRLAGETYFEIWVDYWGAADYADVFTSSACQGTGTFTGESFFTRSECCLMGAQYQNVWMYVIHRLEDSVNDCNAGDLNDNSGGTFAWDEAWAFYAGSLEGTEVGGSVDGGVMLYALAEEMCETFGTCTGDSDGDSLVGISEVNVNLLSLWQIGQAHLEALECDDAAAVIHGIVRLMAVPLVQGLLRLIYEADPDMVGGTVREKEASELWAFSAAILPWINLCDVDVAETVRANTDISSAAAPMSDGFASIKAQLESVYACMGITCAEVGGYINSDTGAYFFEPCTDGTGATSDSTVDSGSTVDTETDTAATSDSNSSSQGVGVTIAVGGLVLVGGAIVIGAVVAALFKTGCIKIPRRGRSPSPDAVASGS